MSEIYRQLRLPSAVLAAGLAVIVLTSCSRSSAHPLIPISCFTITIELTGNQTADGKSVAAAKDMVWGVEAKDSTIQYSYFDGRELDGNFPHGKVGETQTLALGPSQDIGSYVTAVVTSPSGTISNCRERPITVPR